MAPAMWLFSPGTFRAKPLCDKWQIELWEQHRWLEGERYDDDLWAKSWWVDTSYVQDACFMTPRVPAKANIKQWNGEQWPGRSHQSRVTTRTLSLSFPSLSVLRPSFFPSDESRTAPHHAVLPGLQQALWLVLIGIIVWYEAKPLLCLSSYSYHGVTGWHTDSTEILQRAERWKQI